MINIAPHYEDRGGASQFRRIRTPITIKRMQTTKAWLLLLGAWAEPTIVDFYNKEQP